MDEDIQQASAPPVVAVVVVHRPGDWFEELLESLADQDYPNLRLLFLSNSGDAADVEGIRQRVAARLPNAFVRDVGATGFAGAANETLRLVEGDNGFFLLCHDDVALEPDCVRLLVEELYRSNAGVVGPKLLEWDDPGVLQSVGLGADRFGELSNEVEPGEIDQEQHDGVRDVFVIPSACMLVRADLFRTLGGFDPGISLYGEDLELCWRVHHSGARVVVVPSARARHLGALELRRTDIAPLHLAARHRVRAVTTLTAGARLPVRLLQMLLLTLAELIVGPFTGRFRHGWASLRALLGSIVRAPGIIARRRAVAPIRLVPEREVTGLQQRGSARLTTYVRSRDTATYVADGVAVRRWRPNTVTPIIAWVAVVVGVIIGARGFITGGVPTVGEFLRFPESPQSLVDAYRSGWNPAGGGSTSPAPSGWATLAVASIGTLFRTGLLSTLMVVGSVIVGALGMWRLAQVFPSTRAQIAALVMYAASPLVPAAMSRGSFTSLVAFAATPWIVHTLRRAAGIETGAPTTDADVPDAIVQLTPPERVQRYAAAILAVALATALAPVMLVVAAAVTICLVVASLLAFTQARATLGLLVGGTVAVFGAALLNFPWIASWTWEGLVGAAPIGEERRGLWRTAVFEFGTVEVAALGGAAYLALVAAVLLARSWRLTWAVRGGVLAVAFLAAAVAGDRGALPFDAPVAGVLLAPVAVGLALGAASVIAAFDLDVLGGTFGWRQPLGVLAAIAVAVSIIPGALSAADGRWQTPTTTLVRQLQTRLPADVPGGYRTLFVGDARLFPVPATEYAGGVSFALVDDGEIDFTQRWSSPSTGADDTIRTALDEIRTGTTLRAGRLLAPLGVRYVVIPQIDGAVSTVDDPLPVATGLEEALSEQLDLVTQLGPATVRVYENTSWLPQTALLAGPTAAASSTAGAAALIRADLSSWTAVGEGAVATATQEFDVDAGVLHLAVPFDQRWELTVDGRSISPRRAFGLTTAFDLPTAGTARLSYATDSLRTSWLVVQVGLWLLVLLGALQVSMKMSARHRSSLVDETLIDLSAAPSPPTWPIDPSLPIPAPSPEELEHAEHATADAGHAETVGVAASGDGAATPGGADDAVASEPASASVEGTGVPEERS